MVFFILMTLCAGVLMPLQATLNAELSKYLHHPLQAALISFFIGTVGLLLINLIFLQSSVFSLPSSPTTVNLASPSPSPHSSTPNIPLYLFLGGLLGAFFVSVSIFAVKKLGATVMTGVLITGQFAASSLIDHFGLFGLSIRTFTINRLLGLILMLIGIFFIKK